MNWVEREKAMATWRELLTTPKTRMDVAEQYDELVSLADKYQHQGLVNPDEKNAMILEATQHYASAIEGVGQGT
ncbi:hypothetical protein D9M71_717690 [compost metagenome]